MSNYAVMPLNDYVNTCEAIREKTETTELIKSGEMVDKITDVFNAGKKSEYDKFWDSIQDYGNRTDYRYAFSRCAEIDFKPKYDFNFGVSFWMFAYAKNVEFDYVFDLSNASSINNMFYDCNYLKKIKKIILKADGSQALEQIIYECNELEEVEFEGVIGGSNMNCATSSKLNHKSLMSIINTLKDFSGTTTTRTLTLHKNAKARLSESEIAVATQKGWSVA